MSKKFSKAAIQLAKIENVIIASSDDNVLRQRAALNELRVIEREECAAYYLSKYGESLADTIKKAKSDDENSILQLIEWDKLFLAEDYIVAKIKAAEMDLTYFIGNNSYADLESIRKKSKRFLKRLSASVKKVVQLPKLKRYWDLLNFLRAHGHEHTIESLADFARSNYHKFPANSPEENLLTDKRALLVRFIKTHKDFIGLK